MEFPDITFVTIYVLYIHIYSIVQVRVNYGSGTICSLLSFFISPTKLEEVILIVIKSQ